MNVIYLLLLAGGIYFFTKKKYIDDFKIDTIDVDANLLNTFITLNCSIYNYTQFNVPVTEILGKIYFINNTNEKIYLGDYRSTNQFILKNGANNFNLSVQILNTQLLPVINYYPTFKNSKIYFVGKIISFNFNLPFNYTYNFD